MRTFKVGDKVTYRDGMTGKVIHLGPKIMLTVCDQTGDGWMHEKSTGCAPVFYNPLSRYLDADIKMEAQRE